MVEIGFQDGDRMKIPTWLLSAFFATMIIVSGAGLHTWALANSNADTVAKHDARIGGIENKISLIQSDVAQIKQVQQDQEQGREETRDKIDRILALETARQHR
jgi:TolA-binding protein